ncbi:hypothetical protein ACM64Y_19175 [Novispirillum sp. DQ9]|uniref:hypothetical protein n=1 Tax=Novispirillum sp. DQ9 TaxID=3398612 RepID=UPI003C7E791A
MKGPEATRGRPLAERFADLESRINALRARQSATPGEHTVADLVNDLRARCDSVRARLTASPSERADAHFANRGAAATSASRKEEEPQSAEAAYRDLEEAYERALTRFR